MGCDAKASERGTFKLEVREYGGQGKVLGVIEVEGLEPEQPLSIDVWEGTER
jgi:hypothetical protein